MKRLIVSMRISLMLTLLMTVLLGGVYPLLVTAVAQSIFNYRADGSLIERAERVEGSTLLGQEFTSAKYFWGRLSATSPAYNPADSKGSNFNPNNPKVLEAANARIAALQKADPSNRSVIPLDLVTASASGLDPHISLAAAEYQVPRVAKARGLKEDDVRLVVSKAVEKILLSFMVEPYVNVVKLNVALDDIALNQSKKH